MGPDLSRGGGPRNHDVAHAPDRPLGHAPAGGPTADRAGEARGAGVAMFPDSALAPHFPRRPFVGGAEPDPYDAMTDPAIQFLLDQIVTAPLGLERRREPRHDAPTAARRGTVPPRRCW